MKNLKLLLLAVAVPVCGILTAQAVTTIPQSALTPDGLYYTDHIGGGIGSIAVMTGGGNAPGIGDVTGRNDDGFQGPINLGFTLNFFGNNYTTFFANNNGSISFGAGISAYIPTGPTGANAPIISPFFADVDTRNPLSGVMHVRQDIPNELIVTWDQVGYFGEHADHLDSFQLVVRGAGYNVPVGEGAIGFFYKGMGWDVTDTSQVAAVGFGDGLGNGEVIQGSTTPGMAPVLQNHYIWFDANLAPVGVPDSGTTLSLLGLALGGLAVLRSRLQK